MKQVVTIAVSAVLLSLSAVPGYTQAPRTISHQGLLTDTSGDPVPDASRSMTFKIYNVPSGGAAQWSETKNVATSNGVFATELGSATPLTNVNFDQELWLSIKVGSDPEMADRTKLTSVPNAIGLVMPFRDSLRIQTSNLGTDGSEIFGDDISVHAGDAFLGLYSNDIGAAGSGLYLAEIAGGAMTNKWSIYRATTGAGSGLNFTFGSDPQYALNPRVLQFGPSGAIRAADDVETSGEFRYDSPRTRYLQLPVSAFELDVFEEAAGTAFARFHWRRLNGYISMTGIAIDDEAIFSAPVNLPDSAVVKSFTLYYYDNDAGDDMRFDHTLQLRQIGSTGNAGMGSAPVTSSGASINIRSHTIDTSANIHRVIDNAGKMYWVEVGLTRLTNLGGSLRFYGMTIEYEVDHAGR